MGSKTALSALFAFLLALGGPLGLAAQASFEGLASWYGADFQGRPTASGEVFDKEGLSAAHRTLPFGTLLRVTSLETGASVVVRVNDRGPFVGDRVLDLSEAAARLVGMTVNGTARIRAQILSPAEAAAFGSPGPRPAPSAGPVASPLPPPVDSGPSLAARPGTGRIQVASFRDRKNAEASLERLRLSGLAGAGIESSGAYHRVVFAAVPLAELEDLAERLRRLGYRELLVSRPRP